MAQILGKLMFRIRMKSSHQALLGFENIVTSYKHLSEWEMKRFEGKSFPLWALFTIESYNLSGDF